MAWRGSDRRSAANILTRRCVMARQRAGAPQRSGGPTREQPGGARRPSSEVPPAAPAPSIEEVVPPPVAGAGGVENIPEELVPEDKRVEEELDHAGLDAGSSE